MSSAETFTSRLSKLSESLKQTQSLISRLSKLQIQPGTITGTSDAPAELTAEIHGRLREITEALEILREDVDTFAAGSSGRASREGDVMQVEAGTARLEEDIRLARGQFRKAQLQAKQAAETARRKERELLFSSTTEESVNRRKREKREKLTQDDLVASASEDVTAALRRTHALMATELTRSRFAQETLEDSSKALESLGESYMSLDDILKNSKALVSSLLSSQKSDTWYLETTVYVLLSTVIWLIFRRFLYGPLWWFVWLPLKGLYWVMATIIGTSVSVAQSGGSAGSSAVSISASSWVSGQDGVAGGSTTQSGGSSIPTADTSSSGTGSEQGHMEDVQKAVDEANSNQNEAGEGSSGQDHVQEGDEAAQEQQQQRNPKKRMWEEPVEEAKRAAEQEEAHKEL